MCRAQAARPACPHVLTPLRAEITALTHPHPAANHAALRPPRIRRRLTSIYSPPTAPTHASKNKYISALPNAPHAHAPQKIMRRARVRSRPRKRIRVEKRDARDGEAEQTLGVLAVPRAPLSALAPLHGEFKRRRSAIAGAPLRPRK